MGIVHVEFDWDDHYGECNDCGRPAAYRVIGWYGPGTDDLTDPCTLRCSVCAAQDASEGAHIVWLWKEDE